MDFGQFPGLLRSNKILLLHPSQKLVKDEIMSYYFTGIRALGMPAKFYSAYNLPGTYYLI